MVDHRTTPVRKSALSNFSETTRSCLTLFAVHSVCSLISAAFGPRGERTCLTFLSNVDILHNIWWEHYSGRKSGTEYRSEVFQAFSRAVTVDGKCIVSRKLWRASVWQQHERLNTVLVKSGVLPQLNYSVRSLTLCVNVLYIEQQTTNF